MNGIHLNGKVRNSEKTVPGCLGRMVNLFDLTPGVSGNRLLTDKPYNDGTLSRSRSDVSRRSTIVGDEIEDKVMVSSNRKPYGTPVKTLIAQEMSKDLESRNNSPNLVAKLMGLDALPKQQSEIPTQRTPKHYTRKCHSEIPIGYWQEINSDIHSHSHSQQVQNECKDIHEILHQPQRSNYLREKSPQKRSSNENVNEKRMSLIRQKIVEAKRLATDEKLRQTKEFQDALDVLSSNGDLFLKVLQEPNSLFSQQQNRGQYVPLEETKRITVLRPTKMMADEKQVNKHFQVNQVNLWENHPNGFSPTISTWKVNDSPAQPTRIVVLKPTAKLNEVKTGVSSTPSSPRGQKSENWEEDDEAREAREVAKEITQQMRENLAGHRRNETVLSSVYSNGYTGDESSFEKSEIEFADDSNINNLSDLEVMSPTMRHSWDYDNRFGSPYSISSFSRASYSPESSVCREAKKRLSERWVMMSSHGSVIQEQRQFRKSSNTLGEMLALSDTKKPEICEEDSRASTSFLNNNDESPRNLIRSKSVPISSAAYIQVPEAVVCKVDVPKEIVKEKPSKTSFTGKVTSLFFSRTKKCRKEKSGNVQCNDVCQLTSDDTLGRTNSDYSEAVLSNLELNSGVVSVDSQGFQKGAMSMENQEQPSPISVLEQSCEEDESAILGSSYSVDPHGGKLLPHGLSKSSLIDKSPPIGSIARTLSWDESYTDTDITYPINSPYISPGASPEDNEDKWLHLVQSLLTMAGLDNTGPNLARWHTPESPLDPLLRTKYIDLSTNEPLHESKRRQLRSTRKLVFDSVNTALHEIRPYVESGPGLGDRVWGWMKEWLSSEIKYVIDDGGDGNSLVERWVMKEIVGKGWSKGLNSEIEIISKEIEGKLLEELVEFSVVEFIARE